jgi:hypothetical protein
MRFSIDELISGGAPERTPPALFWASASLVLSSRHDPREVEHRPAEAIHLRHHQRGRAAGCKRVQRRPDARTL